MPKAQLNQILGSGFGRTKVKAFLDTVFGSNGIDVSVEHATIRVGAEFAVVPNFQVDKNISRDQIVDLLAAQGVNAKISN